MRKRWIVNKLSERAKSLAKKLHINPIIAHLLLSRQVREDELTGFIDSEISLHEPLLLPDMDLAVRRIKKAVKDKEKILLFGDYDVDGITSLAIFHDYLKKTQADFSFYIPHRIKEGFGLSKQAVRSIKEKGVGIIICFDCGTNSHQEIELARSYGIETVVVDHHQPKDDFDAPLAFINPKRKDSRYPFPDLSSAAVTFKLVQALMNDSCYHLLDLVALSVVCDVVPLRGENRMLLKEGLRRIRRTARPAVSALCQISGVKQENLDVFHLGYILGPRINASGRVSTAHDALNMFLATDTAEAKTYADKLHQYNRIRRDIEKTVLKEAESSLSGDIGNKFGLVVYKQGWHQGVLGIVASRLVDKYYRPTLVIGFDDEKAGGRPVP
ncbi:MAG: DHH family phosphoesterase [Candidatus Omnitrophota bacterium]